MQPTKLLHKILKKSQAISHAKRQESLLNAVDSVIHGGKLSLTSLGRRLQKGIKPKSKIQAINYLLGNGQLYSERAAIYTAMNQWLLRRKKINMLVDWSSIVVHGYHLLRASVVVKGRSLVLWEELHPEELLGNEQVQGEFLKNLKARLPSGLKVCVITDAGFHVDFFKQVIDLGWDYVGRLLTNMHYTLEGESNWQACSDLYELATDEPKYIGAVKLRKQKPFASHLYLYKTKKVKEQRQRKVKYGKSEKEHKNAGNKPWLIASSLKVPAKVIMNFYKGRMKIEHEFRDTKDPRWGIGLRESRSKDPIRLSIQLMISMLALFLLWLIGLGLERQNLHRDFQANSIKHKRVLSLVFLALEAIRERYLEKVKRWCLSEIIEEAFEDNPCCPNYV